MSTSDETDANAVSTPTAPRRRPAWWISASLFVAGVVVGVVVVGLLTSTAPSFVPATTGGTGTPAPSAPEGGVQVAVSAEVNAACLRVINEAQDVYGALSGIDEAAEDVDLQQFDDIVRRLQPIHPRLERDLSDCQVRVQQPGGETSTSYPTSAPTDGTSAQPSASPTG